jgi:hypothetical protein
MPKVGIFGYRLEIDSYTAELITKQQARVVARFPHTPRAELALFPRAHRNPHGTKPIDSSMFGRQLREWAVALPEVWEGEAAGDGGWTPVAGPDRSPGTDHASSPTPSGTPTRSDMPTTAQRPRSSSG